MQFKTLLLSSSLTFTSLMMFSTSTNLCHKIQQSVIKNHIFLDGINYKIIKKQWLKQASAPKQLFSINHNHPFIIDDSEAIRISVIKIENYDLFFQVFAKKVGQNYQLHLKTNELIDANTIKQSAHLQTALKSFIIKDFYEQNTMKRFLSHHDYYAFFDTRDSRHGEMMKNGKVSFDSSWGVWNSAKNVTTCKFNWQDDILKNHILMTESQEWGKLKKENIVIETIKPYAMGFLPIAQIHKPPIGEAYWTLKSIDFHNHLLPKMFYNAKQKLLLPEHHNIGAEWWRGLTSFVTAILKIASFGGGTIAGFLGQTIMSIIINTFSAVSGVGTFINDLTGDGSVSQIPNTHWETLKKQQVGFKKINELIMKESVVLTNSQTIDYRIFDIVGIAPMIDGELEGWANATSLFTPTNSAMSLYTVWNTMSADISYLVYQ